MVEPLVHTLLSIPRYGRIMGINPVHLMGATAGNIFPTGTCKDVWYQHDWQAGDRVSRETLAFAIQSAEYDIAHYLGYWPAPIWVEDEPHPYPRHHRPEVYGNALDARGAHKAVTLEWGRFIQAGIRAVTLLGTVIDAVGGGISYSDPDGDGFDERATITLATTETNACEIKLYYAGHGGEQEYEVRPCLTKSIAGGVFTATLDSWRLIEPEWWELYPTTDDPTPPAIDLTAAASYVISLEIYREYTDFTQPSAVFYWEPSTSLNLPIGNCCSVCGGSGCPACTHTTQNGCCFVRDVMNGIVAVQPSTYDTAAGSWSSAVWAKCIEPDIVKLFYYAGQLSDEYLAGRTCDPLSDVLARCIAYMATARLERPFCSCNNIKALVEHLQTDLTLSHRDSGQRFVTLDIMRSPFGTRRGEVEAWRRLHRMTNQRMSVALM